MTVSATVYLIEVNQSTGVPTIIGMG